MKNPYKVLEINEGASTEEIKKAYKKMVKKYHPDQYQSSSMKDVAEEKMKDINVAYTVLMDGDKGSYNSYRRTSYHTNTSNLHREARAYVSKGYYHKAEQILKETTNRDAEWHFLMGVVYINKGWYDDGLDFVERAAEMDPGNLEYKQTLYKLYKRHEAQQDAKRRRVFGSNQVLCDVCACLICTDCLCGFMGGNPCVCV